MKKADYIKGLLALNTDMTSADLAKKAGCSKRTVRRIKATLKPAPVKTVVGIVSDLHLPFEHKDYFKFVTKTFKKWGVNKVVFIGDIMDFHAASRFQTEPTAMNVVEELKAAKKAVKKWVKAFPEAAWCLGNHDKIPSRQAKAMGMSKEFVVSMHSLFDLPETWVAKQSHMIDGVHYFHGVGSNGMYGAKNTAAKLRCSVVQGHTHQHGGVYYHAGMSDMIFGLNVGCGNAEEGYAVEYAQDYMGKVTHGCGIVVDGKEAHFIPMM